MRRNVAVWTVVAVLGLGAVAGARSAFSQDGGGEKPAEGVKAQDGAKPEDGAKPAGGESGGESGGPSAAEMEAWQKYMTPGPEHERLAKQAGEWTVTGKLWMGGPEPVATESKATIRMILGGRYQVQDYSGSMMGTPFDGVGTTAFDNASKEYVGTWIDSLGTGVTVLRGKADDKGVIVMTGDMPMPDGSRIPVRETFAAPDADTLVMEMFMTMPGQAESKMMELRYTRRK